MVQMKIASYGEFPGSPVVRTLCWEPRSHKPWGEAKKKASCTRAKRITVVHSTLSLQHLLQWPAQILLKEVSKWLLPNSNMPRQTLVSPSPPPELCINCSLCLMLCPLTCPSTQSLHPRVFAQIYLCHCCLPKFPSSALLSPVAIALSPHGMTS